MSNLTCTCGAILNHIDEPCPECLPSMAWRPSTKVCQECTRLTSERDEYWKERGEALTEVAELREKLKAPNLFNDAGCQYKCHVVDALKVRAAELEIQKDLLNKAWEAVYASRRGYRTALEIIESKGCMCGLGEDEPCNSCIATDALKEVE